MKVFKKIYKLFWGKNMFLKGLKQKIYYTQFTIRAIYPGGLWIKLKTVYYFKLNSFLIYYSFQKDLSQPDRNSKRYKQISFNKTFKKNK